MANINTQNPIIWNTVGATSKMDGSQVIGNIFWSGYSSGATLEITNALGTRSLVKVTAPATYEPINLFFDGGFSISDGIALKTLSSGELYIYQTRS